MLTATCRVVSPLVFFQGWDLGELSSSHLYSLFQSCQGKFDICWQDKHLWLEGCVPGSMSGFFPGWSGLASRKDWFTSSAVQQLCGSWALRPRARCYLPSPWGAELGSPWDP